MPVPLPSSFVVKYGSKTLVITSLLIPPPLSLISMIIDSLSVNKSIHIFGSLILFWINTSLAFAKKPVVNILPVSISQQT